MRLVVGISGASGSVYAQRMLRALLDLGHEVHLVASLAAHRTWEVEIGRPLDAAELGASRTGRLSTWGTHDFMAPIASGSFRHDGMVVLPCSGRTLGALATGVGDTLVARAADTCLKERRRLVLVVRETPLSLVHLENMLTVTRAGAIVMPASPGFYHRPETVADLVDFVIARALDHLGVEHQVGRRWRDPAGAGESGTGSPAAQGGR